MSKLLQVYRLRPFLPIGDGSVNKALVAETWPHPLLYAVQYLPHKVRSEFPTLLASAQRPVIVTKMRSFGCLPRK